MEQICNPIFDVTIHAFDTSSAVRLRSSPNLTPDRIFVLPFPVTLTTLTLNQRSSRRFGNYFWKSSPEGLPPSFPQLRAKLSCSRGTPDPCERNYRTRLLPRVIDAKPFIGIGVSVAVLRDIALYQFSKLLPWQPMPPASPLQHSSPCSANFAPQTA